MDSFEKMLKPIEDKDGRKRVIDEIVENYKLPELPMITKSQENIIILQLPTILEEYKFAHGEILSNGKDDIPSNVKSIGEKNIDKIKRGISVISSSEAKRRISPSENFESNSSSPKSRQKKLLRIKLRKLSETFQQIHDELDRDVSWTEELFDVRFNFCKASKPSSPIFFLHQY